MRIHLPFQPQWRAAVLAGTKTTTVRTKRYGQPGDDFEVEGHAFRLVSVQPTTLAAARDTVWREEGMSSVEEFARIWKENHPSRGFRGEDQVWIHLFSRVT